MIEKITLRKWKKSDINTIMEFFVNEKIVRPLNVQKKFKDIDRKFEVKWLSGTIKNYKTKKPEEYNLAIILNNQVIGGIGLGSINYYHNKADCGYWLAQPYWGKGYTTKALKAFIDEMIKKFKLVRLTAYVNEYNKSSARVLEKNGFKLECIRRKAVKDGNKHISDKQYALVK